MGEKQHDHPTHPPHPTRPARPTRPTRRRWWPRWSQWSRRTRIWTVVSVVGAVVVGGPVALMVWAMLALDEAGEARPLDCALVMDWAGATLPKSAEGARCTEATWLDVHDQADFRMPAAEVAGWVAGTWPGIRSETAPHCSKGEDFCLHLLSDEHEIAWYDGPGQNAAGVNVSVRYEDGGTALVTVTAYTI
ncbi:hypothetical protein ABZ990_11225 [Streptomyces sp. NPDC046203]|uniref:hypothetical protein n=1 Tax=Streptomyces sp. NPDC046203 TaxID=3154602 RepID=UPI0033DE1B2D